MQTSRDERFLVWGTTYLLCVDQVNFEDSSSAGAVLRAEIREPQLGILAAAGRIRGERILNAPRPRVHRVDQR